MKKLILFAVLSLFISSANLAQASFSVDETGTFTSFEEGNIYYVWVPGNALTDMPVCVIGGADLMDPTYQEVLVSCGDNGSGTYTILETVGDYDYCTVLNYEECLAHENYEMEVVWSY